MMGGVVRGMGDGMVDGMMDGVAVFLLVGAVFSEGGRAERRHEMRG